MNINQQNPPNDKPLIWFSGKVKTPPFSSEARIEVGYLLRLLQKGEFLSLPQSRPMPILVRDVMNSELMMRTRLGELFIVLMKMP